MTIGPMIASMITNSHIKRTIVSNGPPLVSMRIKARVSLSQSINPFIDHDMAVVAARQHALKRTIFKPRYYQKTGPDAKYTKAAVDSAGRRSLNQSDWWADARASRSETTRTLPQGLQADLAGLRAAATGSLRTSLARRLAGAGHPPARSEWNPFAALQRYAGCRVKTGKCVRKLEMTCMTRTGLLPSIDTLDARP